MAVVGEAYILVRAITTEIKSDIAKGFEGVRGQSTKEGHAAGQAFGQGFGKKMRDEATESARAFHQLMRRGYSIQAGIGTLITSISALIGGLGALSGALIGAAASGVALVGVMAQLKVAGIVGKMAFKGVMEAVQKTGSEGVKSLRELREEMQQLAFDAEEAALSEQQAALKLESARETLARVQDLPPNNRARREAELAYQQAELAYRRAKDKNNDLQEELAKPADQRKNAGGQDPYANLTKTQATFARYLATVKPRMKELREAAASSFLPELTKQMKVMFAGGYFDMLIKGFRDVSAGLGKAVSEFANTVFDPKNKANLAEFFKATGNTLGTMGRVVGNFFGLFLTVLKAADPLINRLVHFLDRKSFSLGEASKKNFAQLHKFFTDAGNAASTFGRFLSNIFQPFKRLVMSQVGEGSPGREFLKWMQESTEQLREFRMGADGLTLDEKLAPTVENTKAMFQAFSGLARIFFELGQNPGVKEFWTTLASGTGALETIFKGIAEATGPAFARVIVSLTEIVAAFLDQAQLGAYFNILSEIFKVFAVFAAGLGKLMAAFGPLVGAIGAVVTSMLLLKKVFMLFYGTYGIIRGAIMTLTVLTYKQAIAQKTLNTVEGFGLLLQKKQLTAKQLDAVATYRQTIADNTKIAAGKKKNMLAVIDNLLAGKTLTKKQALIAAEMAQTLKTDLNTGALYRNIGASTAASLKNGTLAGSFLAAGASSAAATPPMTIFGIAVNAALWPIVAIAGVVALAIAGIAFLIAKHNDDVKNAVKNTENSLKKVKDSGTSTYDQVRFAQESWSNSLSSSWSPMKNSIRDVTKLAGVNALLQKQQKGVNYAYRYSGNLTYEQRQQVGAYKEALNNLGTALGNIAKKNLPAAQQSFIRFANANKLSKDGLLAQLKEMPNFTKQLAKTAEKYGLVNDQMSEQQKQAVYLDIALNRGTYATAKFAEAQKKLGKEMAAAAATFIDVNAPLEKFTKKGIVDLNGYQKALDKQVEEQQDWFSNLTKVQQRGGKKLSQATYKALINMGKDGAGLVAQLADTANTSQEEFDKLIASFSQTIPDVSAGLADALTSPEQVLAIVKEKLVAQGNYNAGTILGTLQKDLEKGNTTIGKIMGDYGITVQEVMQKLADEKPISQTVTWDGDSIKKAQTDLAEKLSGDYNISIRATENQKDGGLIGSLSGFKNGGAILRKFAPGGQVFGQGGPRSDKVPAMLSNGEYVINAAATARTLPLLNAINYGVTQRNADTATMVGGGGGALMNSINITVNPSPGMDETELAAMVSRELSFQMRRGAIS